MCKNLEGWRQFVFFRDVSRALKRVIYFSGFAFPLEYFGLIERLKPALYKLWCLLAAFVLKKGTEFLCHDIMWEVCIHDMCRLTRLDSCVGFFCRLGCSSFLTGLFHMYHVNVTAWVPFGKPTCGLSGCRFRTINHNSDGSYLSWIFFVDLQRGKA